jgi:choline dehydrogenase-like flavoprotein
MSSSGTCRPTRLPRWHEGSVCHSRASNPGRAGRSQAGLLLIYVRALPWAGGCGIHNAMLYMRGRPEDFEHWGEGWNPNPNPNPNPAPTPTPTLSLSLTLTLARRGLEMG